MVSTLAWGTREMVKDGGFAGGNGDYEGTRVHCKFNWCFQKLPFWDFHYLREYKINTGVISLIHWVFCAPLNQI